MASRRPPRKDDRPHVVIIGGGFGGLNAAKKLGDEPVRVTIVDRANHHLFQPLLYQVAMAGLSPADIAYPVRSVLRGYQNVTTLLAEVVGVDLDARKLHLHDGAELGYDYLVVAAGARTNYFGHDEDWGKSSLALKTIEDALEVRRRVLLAFETAEREPDPEERSRLLSFVIIGGGPTGVEIAGAIRDLARAVLTRDFRVIDPTQTRVIVIEMQDRILPAGFSEKLSESARRQLEELGVEVRTQTRVDGIDERGVVLGDERLDAGTVLWTAGVMARRLTQKLGVELDRQGRIPVGADLALPDRPEVFAIGDNARFVPEGESDPLPGLAAVAMQQGKHVAKNVLRAVRGEPRQPFRYVNKGIMATIGRKRAVVQFPKLEMRGVSAWVIWLFVHIMLLVGFRNRVVVLLNWFWHYATYRSGARLITGWRSWDWETQGGLQASQHAARRTTDGAARRETPAQAE